MEVFLDSEFKDDDKVAGKLIRLPEVLKILPISKSTWWKGVAEGRYPQSIRLGTRITCWRLNDILALVDKGTVQKRIILSLTADELTYNLPASSNGGSNLNVFKRIK